MVGCAPGIPGLYYGLRIGTLAVSPACILLHIPGPQNLFGIPCIHKHLLHVGVHFKGSWRGCQHTIHQSEGSSIVSFPSPVEQQFGFESLGHLLGKLFRSRIVRQVGYALIHIGKYLFVTLLYTEPLGKNIVEICNIFPPKHTVLVICPKVGEAPHQVGVDPCTKGPRLCKHLGLSLCRGEFIVGQ
ncbi:hypothetical protein SDC9_153589 [bioreactor metagenome]|uniref:Uncharacterized protein n=1 Tax=bioreactor metagenome TaxID=1076179 RepID=A0A645F100_9ZZZZ